VTRSTFRISPVSGPTSSPTGATIFLKNNVEFPIGSRINVLGVFVPTPGYVVNYSSNPNFYQNAFSGAVFDIGVPFHGAGRRDLGRAHPLRPVPRLLHRLDQHFVHNLDYAVFSVDPLTQNQRQYNAILYKRLSPDVESADLLPALGGIGVSQRADHGERLRELHDQRR